MRKIFAALAIAAMCASSQALPAKDKTERPSTAAKQQQTASKVNINSATTSQLAAVLKGVGLKKAKAIIDYRNKYGNFKSIDELTAVKGIGSKTLEKNRTKISL